MPPFAFLILASSFLLSCLAPVPAPEKPPAAIEEPAAAYESIAASIAVGNPEQALDEYDRALREKPLDKETRILHARLLIIAGKLDEARDELDLLLAEDSNDAAVLYNLSVLEGLEGNRKVQKELLVKAAAADPRSADALSALGDIALEEKDLGSAGGYFTRSLECDPANFVALLGQGGIFMEGKEYQKASDAYSKAIEAQPDYSFSYVDRARARKALGNAVGAIQDLSQAIRLDPGYSWSYIDRGKLYIQTGKQDLALEDFSIAIELGPEIFAGYAMRAEILYRRQEYEKALADYKKVVTLRPDYYFAYDPLGVISFMNGDWVGARKSFLEAYRYVEDDHSYALLAALTWRKEGNPRAASDYLQGILPKLPRDSWYFETARFLMDPASSSLSMSARVDREKTKTIRARMAFYLAEEYLIEGKVRPAQACLFDSEGMGAPDAAETRLAQWELDTLKGKE